MARRFSKNTEKTLGLFGILFSVISQQLHLFLPFGLLRSSFISSPALSFLICLFWHKHQCSEEKKPWSPFSAIRSYLSERSTVRIRWKIFLLGTQTHSWVQHVKPVLLMVLSFRRAMENKQHYLAEESWPFLQKLSFSWLGEPVGKASPPPAQVNVSSPMGSSVSPRYAMSKSRQHR